MKGKMIKKKKKENLSNYSVATLAHIVLYTIFFWVIGNENVGKFVMTDV